MTLIHYLRGAVLGAALAFGCGPKEGFDNEEREEQSLEVRVQRDITDSNGLAFSGAQEILVRDAGSPVANEEVTLYGVISQGDVYLTAANGGGIALFPDSRRRHGGSSGRELNVNEPQQLNSSREELLSGLLRWSLSDFSCVAAESVPANGVPRVIIYSDKNGRRVAFGGDYSRLQLDAPGQFYSFDPAGEGVPLLIPDAIAQAVFSESLYERIRRECRGGSSASCSGEVLFEDEFEGKELDLEKWDGLPCSIYRLSNGTLELNPQRGSCILQSRSTYSLSDGPLCFEARWRVREREGIGISIGLNSDKASGPAFINQEIDKSLLACIAADGKNNEILECGNVNVTDYVLTHFYLSREEVNFTINNDVRGSSSTVPPEKHNLYIEVVCQSLNAGEKHCDIDYLRLTR